MAKIHTVIGRQIFDSRGWPTVEVTVWLDNGVVGVSSVPSVESHSSLDPKEVRDEDQNIFFGKGVNKVISSINTQIAPKLRGLDPSKQSEIDKVLLELDGTKDKSNLGINAIVPVSQAVLKAGAALFRMPLYEYIGKKYQLVDSYATPMPIVTIINGGKLGIGNLDFQEFLIIPSSRHMYRQAIQICSDVYHAVQKSLISNSAIHSVGCQGGFTPNLYTNIDALEVVYEAVKMTPYFAGQDVFLGIDVNADNLYQGGKYTIKDKSKSIGKVDLGEYYKELNAKYHLFYLEDPYASTDWSAWSEVTFEIGKDTLIAADRITSGDKDKISQIAQKKSATAICIKPSQIGTVTEVMDKINHAKDLGLNVIICHRLAETNDTFIADLAVGVGSEYVKFGAMARGERVVKYNRLLQIEDTINPATPSVIPA